MRSRKYHGWIFAEKDPGMKDHFSVQVRSTDEEPSYVVPTGIGEKGAAAAVDYFETRLKIGRVKLERTPLGLRVYTEEPEPKKEDPC